MYHIILQDDTKEMHMYNKLRARKKTTDDILQMVSTLKEEMRRFELAEDEMEGKISALSDTVSARFELIFKAMNVNPLTGNVYLGAGNPGQQQGRNKPSRPMSSPAQTRGRSKSYDNPDRPHSAERGMGMSIESFARAEKNKRDWDQQRQSLSQSQRGMYGSADSMDERPRSASSGGSSRPNSRPNSAGPVRPTAQRFNSNANGNGSGSGSGKNPSLRTGSPSLRDSGYIKKAGHNNSIVRPNSVGSNGRPSSVDSKASTGRPSLLRMNSVGNNNNVSPAVNKHSSSPTSSPFSAARRAGTGGANRAGTGIGPPITAGTKLNHISSPVVTAPAKGNDGSAHTTTSTIVGTGTDATPDNHSEPISVGGGVELAPLSSPSADGTNYGAGNGTNNGIVSAMKGRRGSGNRVGFH